MSNAFVFISYARKDKPWLDRLLEHLRPLQKQLGCIWSDEDIQMGANWHENIQRSLEHARAAVLLISSAFLNSEYIRNNELPVLLEKAHNKRLEIIPIIVGQCLFKEVKFRYPDPQEGPKEILLSSFQAANLPTQPLSGLSKHKRDEIFVYVAKKLLEIIEDSKSHIPNSQLTTIREEESQSRRFEQEIQSRRFEAAIPKKSILGRKTEVRIMIALLNSSGLRAYLPDYTEAGDLISKQDVIHSNFPLEFPLEPNTNKVLPTNISVSLTAPDFEIEENTKSLRLFPKHDSGVVTFFLTPRIPQEYGIVRVELFQDEQPTIVLSSLTLRTEISRQQDSLKGQAVWQIVTSPLAISSQSLIPFSESSSDRCQNWQFTSQFVDNILEFKEEILWGALAVFGLVVALNFGALQPYIQRVLNPNSTPKPSQSQPRTRNSQPQTPKPSPQPRGLGGR